MDADSQVLMLLGELKSDVKALQRTSERVSREQSAAADRLISLETAMTRLAESSATNEELMAKRIVPAVVTVEQLQFQGRLAMTGAATISASVTALVAANWNTFWEWLKNVT